MTGMTIGQIAKRAGVGVETIRFYQRKGLIQQPPKPVFGGHRTYSETALRRLQFIHNAQELGFTLREINELLSLRTLPEADAGDIRRLALDKLNDIDRKMARLQSMRRELSDVLAACPGRGDLNCCTILNELDESAPADASAPDNGEDVMQTVILDIEGMHCSGCAQTIQHVLERSEGVKGCVVSLEENQARVAFEPDQTNPGRLEETVRNAGYAATEREA